MDNKIDSHQLFLFLYYMIILQKSPKHDSAQKARDLPAGRQVQGAKFSRNEAYRTPQIGFFQQNHYIIKHESVLYFMGWRKHMTMSLMKSLFTKELCMIINKYSVNPLSALKRLPFSGFQSSLIADRRGSAIRPAIETLQKANRSCGRARTATVHWKGIFL
ncbi:MAG: hypothetical protein C4B57_02050 [Deltaproteobacteria bacterium]|nr:MAG: hypothetical protein C4B57_02050 [Deltaproteobacteria bacterium]